MKKLSILIILFLFSVSCKKKYTCWCTTTILFKYSQDSYLSKHTQMTEKMTEKQAKAVCDHEARNIDTTYINLITNNGNWASNGIEAHSSCGLE